jgi:hypothetical protein
MRFASTVSLGGEKEMEEAESAEYLLQSCGYVPNREAFKLAYQFYPDESEYSVMRKLYEVLPCTPLPNELTQLLIDRRCQHPDGVYYFPVKRADSSIEFKSISPDCKHFETISVKDLRMLTAQAQSVADGQSGGMAEEDVNALLEEFSLYKTEIDGGVKQVEKAIDDYWECAKKTGSKMPASSIMDIKGVIDKMLENLNEMARTLAVIFNYRSDMFAEFMGIIVDIANHQIVLNQVFNDAAKDFMEGYLLKCLEGYGDVIRAKDDSDREIADLNAKDVGQEMKDTMMFVCQTTTKIAAVIGTAVAVVIPPVGGAIVAVAAVANVALESMKSDYASLLSSIAENAALYAKDLSMPSCIPTGSGIDKNNLSSLGSYMAIAKTTFKKVDYVVDTSTNSVELSLSAVKNTMSIIEN